VYNIGYYILWTVGHTRPRTQDMWGRNPYRQDWRICWRLSSCLWHSIIKQLRRWMKV